MARLILLSLSLMVLLLAHTAATALAKQLKSPRLCSQCSACDVRRCPPSEAYPHITAYDNSLIAGALQSDFVPIGDLGIYAVPNIKGGESDEYNEYYGWQSTSGSASGFHRYSALIHGFKY